MLTPKDNQDKMGPVQNNQQNVMGGQMQTLKVLPKLEVNQPGDEFEREADQVAHDIVHRKESGGGEGKPGGEGPGYHQMPNGQFLGTGKHTLQSGKRTLLSRKSNSPGGMEVSSGFATQLSSTKGSGKPLTGAVKTEMESGLGADLGSVRLHDNSHAANLSQQINAKAFTHGQDVYFNQGQMDLSSTGGKELLAHELVHTLQQGKDQTLRRQHGEDDPLVANGEYVINSPEITKKLVNYLNTATSKEDFLAYFHKVVIEQYPPMLNRMPSVEPGTRDLNNNELDENYLREKFGEQVYTFDPAGFWEDHIVIKGTFLLVDQRYTGNSVVKNVAFFDGEKDLAYNKDIARQILEDLYKYMSDRGDLPDNSPFGFDDGTMKPAGEMGGPAGDRMGSTDGPPTNFEIEVRKKSQSKYPDWSNPMFSFPSEVWTDYEQQTAGVKEVINDLIEHGIPPNRVVKLMIKPSPTYGDEFVVEIVEYAYNKKAELQPYKNNVIISEEQYKKIKAKSE